MAGDVKAAVPYVPCYMVCELPVHMWEPEEGSPACHQVIIINKECNNEGREGGRDG